MKKNKKCPHCDYLGKDNWDVKRHIKRKHTPIECRHCGKQFTKHESNTVGSFCSVECRKKNKQNWSKKYGQKPERKEASRIIQRRIVAKKKAENPEWGLVPLVETVCSICNTVFSQRGSRRKFCSDTCSEINRKQYQNNILKNLREATIKRVEERTTTKQCLSCKKTFTTSHHGVHKFCSPKCRHQWGRDTRTDEQKARLREWEKQWKRNPNSPYNRPSAILSRRIRGGIRQSLRYKGIKKTNKTYTLLGYTKEQLKKHIESKFNTCEKTKGMSWERFDEIHIDHIRPVVSFNYTTTDCEDFKKCWALENLQPLWAKDNLSKGSEWEGKRWSVKT